MRRISAKKVQHRAAVDPVRRKFSENVGRCERCGRSGPCSCHEIAHGFAKEECEKHPGLWLNLCDGVIDAPCHPEVQAWPEAKQLAAFLLSLRANAPLYSAPISP